MAPGYRFQYHAPPTSPPPSMMQTSSTPACLSRAPVTRPAKPPPMNATVTSSRRGARSTLATYGSSRKCAKRPRGWTYCSLPSGRSRLSRSSRYFRRRAGRSIASLGFVIAVLQCLRRRAEGRVPSGCGCAALRSGNHGAVADEHRNPVERRCDRERRRPGVQRGLVPVVAPRPAREIDLAAALPGVPHRGDQEVGTEQILVPAVAQGRIEAIDERHRAHDRDTDAHPGRRRDDVGLQEVTELDVSDVDVDQLRIDGGDRRHVPGRVIALAADLHDAREGAELEPACEDLAVAELVVAARVRAPHGISEERGAL